jgi:hypothetical protein
LSSAKFVAVACAALVVAIVVVFSSSQIPEPKQTSTTGSRILSTSTNSSTLSASFSTSGNSYCPEITVTFANMTWVEPPACAPPIFPGEQFQNVTLESPEVQAFIKSAYEYHQVYYRMGNGSQEQTDEILNVTGKQIVTGNWSVGYTDSYIDNHLLNLTVAEVNQTYVITHLSVYSLPDRNYSVTFTSAQKEIISGAVSNSTVESLMGGKLYHVVYVSPLETNDIEAPPNYPGNRSIALPDTYFVQFNLVNGTANVGAYLNENFTTIASSFADGPFSTECFGGSLVISDPWWFYSGEVLQNNASCPP